MQNQNPIIKNYILSSSPFVLTYTDNYYIKKCNKKYKLYYKKNFFGKMVVKYNRVF